MTMSPVRVASVDGLEIWKLTSSGVEQFGVRLGERRARCVSTLDAAQAILARHVRIGRMARAH